MSNMWCLLLATLPLITKSDTIYRDEDCMRVRKPFHTMTEDERMLYVRGFQELRKNGKLKIIADTHAANVAVHKGSSFFFFHAYMIWEAETAIRELGDEFECFSMPYWDYTIDAGKERDPTLFHLNVGGNGNPRFDFCMDDELWQVPNYWSTDADTCMDDEQRNPPYCCLKRSVSDTQLLPNVMEIAAVFLKNPNFLLFETQIDHYHVWPHFYLAVNTWSQMATAYAVDDPIFFLLHTFTLYQRALWSTCYEYDEIDIHDLQSHKDAYTPSCNPNMEDCGVVGIDAPYNLYPLNQVDWSLASSMDITPRKLYDIKDWNVQYDLGTFWKRSKLNEWCEERATHNSGTVKGVNPDWFVDLTSDYDDSVIQMEADNELSQFIESTWNDLKSQQRELDISDEEIYYAVESISCKYHRMHSENSCYDINDEVMNNEEYETCDSRDIFDPNLISLEQMLEFDGVKENACLAKRRQQLYSVSKLDSSLPLQICNGDFDYKCPEWSHPAVKIDEFSLNIQMKNNYKLFTTYNESAGYSYMILLSLVVFLVFTIAFVMKKWCAISISVDMTKWCIFSISVEFALKDGSGVGKGVDQEPEVDAQYGTFLSASNLRSRMDPVSEKVW
eukprot:CAMPEP_0197073002 /NCGR_PEP_ID=MMETSP1384-20130603/210382_1 /TAXON_ID=29189 /ORGANISM="Ammonia sp." /LENGTH=615 /DNA_ID=CAMNT_0042511827 /DNA_START=44 /DNA_END=1888 /DNA_ORIENTATION=+